MRQQIKHDTSKKTLILNENRIRIKQNALLEKKTRYEHESNKIFQ